MAATALARVFADGLTPRSPPNLLPLRRAAASASLVRLLIMPASSSANETLAELATSPVEEFERRSRLSQEQVYVTSSRLMPNDKACDHEHGSYGTELRKVTLCCFFWQPISF
jgi:hypothetical protein